MKSSFYTDNAKELDKILKDYYTKTLLANHLWYSANLGLSCDIQANVMKHPMRQYQMDALHTMDALLLKYQANDNKWTKLLSDKISTKKIDLSMTFNMATGSGKTQVIGAMIYWLHKIYKIKNFLFFTPPAKSVIYHKSKLNFDKSSKSSIWGDGCDIEFNIIHGENFENASLYDDNANINIFVFNTEKFSATSKRTAKAWETSKFQDQNGHNISLKEYLIQDHNLIIITDEAHHMSNMDKATKGMIADLNPRMLLEFTATAQEGQHVVYDYGIDILLEQKLCKTVWISAVDPQDNSKDTLSSSNKYKICLLFLVHLAKSNALKKHPNSSISTKKAISLIKVKKANIEGERLYSWIKNDLINEFDTYLSQIKSDLQGKHTPIYTLIIQLLNTEYANIDNLKLDITRVCNNFISLFENSNTETRRLFDEIHRNSIEMVLYNNMLDEGIDIPNIYSVCVINDTDSDATTSVKQVIGRGIRLFPQIGTRQNDEGDDILLQSTEQLHIISEKGKNFVAVVNQLREEWDLHTKKHFHTDAEEETVQNEISDPDNILKDKKLPIFATRHIRKHGVTTSSIINDINTVVEQFFKHNCLRKADEGDKRILRFIPNVTLVELEILRQKDDISEQLRETGKLTQLFIKESWLLKSAQRISKNVAQVGVINDESFIKYAKQINKIGLHYYKLDDTDEEKASKIFQRQFEYFYGNHIRKSLTDLRPEATEESDRLLNNIFDTYILKDISIYPYKIEPTPKLIKSGYYFDKANHNWGHCLYKYSRFDSSTEFQCANILEKICKNTPQSLWITNQRNFNITYGSKHYFPDFILITNGEIYIIEIKGEFYSDSLKNQLLKMYGDKYQSQKIHTILLFDEQINALAEQKEVSIQDLISHNQLIKYTS